MAFFVSTFKPYRVVSKKLAEAIKQSGALSIIDLCTGAGKPTLTALRELFHADDNQFRVILTDKHPNIHALRRLSEKYDSHFEYLEEPVDATNIPDNLKGFRTFFESFHHFDKETARKILADAALKKEGIGIFEYTDRNFLIWGIALLLTPAFMILSTFFIRPVTIQRLLWMVIFPILPFIATWDGFVSCLRTYSPKELNRMTDSLDCSDFHWETGRVRSFGVCYITFLIGYPKRLT
jgi:ubiquinone/menaquinone biosynthesis C-methylase UbiE